MTQSPHVDYLRRMQPVTNLENEFSSNGHAKYESGNHFLGYLSLGAATGFVYLGFKHSPLWFIPALISGLFAVDDLVERDGSYSGRQTY